MIRNFVIQAFEICEERDYVEEMVFLLGKLQQMMRKGIMAT